MSVAFPPGWYQDPTGQGQARYWNGTSWTQSVNVNGATANIAIDPSQAEVPPVPGTQVSIPAAPTQTVASSGGSSSGSSMGIFIGIAIAVLVGVVIFFVVGGGSDDETPTPGSTPATEAPAAPATEAPAAPADDAPADGG